MLLPLSVDVSLPRRPYANWCLIAATTAAFLATTEHLFLDPDHLPALALHGFGIGVLTHVLVHADLLHLFGNMLFLWVFGNAVCARIGAPLHLGCYALFAVAGGMVHLLWSDLPAVGASGAINGMVGMFLVFFPKDYVRLSILGGSRAIEVPAWTIIACWLLLDVLGLLSGARGIGYDAHLVGFAAGVTTSILLLKFELAGESDSPTLLDLKR